MNNIKQSFKRMLKHVSPPVSSGILFQLLTVVSIAALTLILDYVYLNAHLKYFEKIFKGIQGTGIRIRYPAVILCYIFIIFSIYYFGFIIHIGLGNMFVLGLVTYGIYELTNFASFVNWPLYMVIVDTLWGGVLYLSVFSVTNYLLSFSK